MMCSMGQAVLAKTVPALSVQEGNCSAEADQAAAFTKIVCRQIKNL